MATTVNIDGVGTLTLNTHQAPKGPVTTAFDATSRAALADDNLRKVREAATKSNLTAKLTKTLQVSTFDPADMKDSNNFFNFVNQWQTIVLLMTQHLTAYFMTSPFILLKKHVVTAPSAEAQLEFQARLMSFMTDALAAEAANPTTVTRDAAGVIQSYHDGTNNVVRPAVPTTTTTLVQGANILTSFENVSIEEVLFSVKLLYDYADNEIHRQNLVWSFTYMMDCLDADLQSYILSKLSGLEQPYANTGPVVFYLVAQRIIATSENLAQKVINGFMRLRLTHFPGESVVECIFTLRNLLKFLRFGETTSFAPRTTIPMIYDVFRGTSVGSFRAYVQQLQDFELTLSTNVETIFDKVQLKYDELVLSDRWVPTKKKGSAFLVGRYEDADDEKSAPKEDKQGKKGEDSKKKKGDDVKKDSNGRWLVDRRGNKIDRTPPKKGQPHQRDNEKGYPEFWCGRKECTRWGNHPTKDHDEWSKDAQAYNKKKREERANAASTTPRPAGSVTFLSALTNGFVTPDPDLVDGIDM